MIQVRCPEPADTQALGGRLASTIRPGDIVVLAGGLGSGKTLFTGGLAAGLGAEEQVVSPSFVLVREYRSGFMPIYHADVYRLGSINEFDDLGVVEMARDGVLVIEWGDAIESNLPEDHLRVEFLVEADQTRVLKLSAFGSWEERDLQVVV